MGTIRVLIGEMPVLLRSLVEGILDEDPQFEIRSEGVSPRRSDEPESFDVLVVAECAMKRVFPQSIVWDSADRLGIVAISPDGLNAAVLRLRSHCRKLNDGSPQSLSQAILDAAGMLPESR